MNYHITCILRKDKKNKKGECPLQIRYTYQRKFVYFPIGASIPPDSWDDEDKFPIQNKTPNFKKLINQIHGIQNSIENLVREYESKYGEIPSANELKDVYQNGVKPKKPLLISDLLQEYIQYTRSETEIRFATTKNYTTLQSNWNKFETKRNNKFNVYQLNKQLIQDFQNFLQNEGLQFSSVGNNIKNLKSFISKYLYGRLNIKIEDNIREVKVYKRDHINNDVLSEEELEELKEFVFYSRYKVNSNLITDVKLTDKQKQIGRMFLFFCSTGLSFTDLNRLTFRDITLVNQNTALIEKTEVEIETPKKKNYYEDKGFIIEIERQKTRTTEMCQIPIFGRTLELLIAEHVNVDGDDFKDLGISEVHVKQWFDKLKNSILKKDKNAPLFPKISNPYFNREIKVICSYLPSLNKDIRIKSDNKKEEVTYVPKYNLISSHTGRRTYITINLNNGVRVDLLMKTTGHKKFDTLKKYIKQTKETISNEFENKIRN